MPAGIAVVVMQAARQTEADHVFAGGAERARMIALAFGALTAMALAALLIWFVLADPVFVLYATLFFLQALYIAYLSGQGFDWPWLSFAAPTPRPRIPLHSAFSSGLPAYASTAWVRRYG